MLPLRAITRAASNPVIQRASSAATKWTVPRIGQVRRIARSAMARSMSASVVPGRREPSAQSEPRKSCACTAPSQRTSVAGSACAGGISPWLASRRAPIVAVVVAAARCSCAA